MYLDENKWICIRTKHTHVHVQTKGKASGGRSRLTFIYAKEMRCNSKGWPRTKIRRYVSIDWSIDQSMVHPLWARLWILIRRAGDGGHLFRCVLALCQSSALHRLKLQPSVVAVHHHRAKSKELQKIKNQI